MNKTKWFAENGGQNIKFNYRYRSQIYSGRSKYQQIDIVDTYEYGRILFLDEVAQSSERDEYIYHEALVHPALLTHPGPETVCVIGGAEGATVREIFRHPSVKRVVMVDIDEEVVRLCRQYLPEWNAGCFDDPRLELRIEDGRKYLEETRESFDVIMVDLSDPVPESPAVYLFTKEFYQVLHDRLTDRGVVCYQAESLQPWRVELHARMFNTLAQVFPLVLSYPYYLPAFHEIHGFILTSKKDDPREVEFGKIMGNRGLDLRYLSPGYFKGLFFVPGYVEQAYRDYPEPLTDAKPLTAHFRAKD